MISSLSLASWLRGLIAYIKYQFKYYLREESKEECQEETIQNKADKQLIILYWDNKSIRQTKMIQ